MANFLTPAAEYVRMSTVKQEYSILNQQTAIAEYASLHGFQVIRTYSDPGKSGLEVKHREGLIQLIRDVTNGSCPYKAILVYDVSRWGRFQDNDEAAYLEFVCKSAGAPIHYCSEPFANDCTVPSLIMKALKRTMAGEYSRELGNRIYAAQKRMVTLGFKMGAKAGYGLCRKLVSSNPKRNRILNDGEYKGIMSDHVVYVPGPRKEVEVVRRIYELYLNSRGQMGTKRIANYLNENGIPFSYGKRWDFHAVGQILTNPKYAGVNTWGRTSQRLGQKPIKQSQDSWVTKANAFPAIITRETFDRVQRLRERLKQTPTEEQMLRPLKRVLDRKGKLSRRIIDDARATWSVSFYRKRFRNLQNIYDLLNVEYSPKVFQRRAEGLKSERLRDEVVKKLMKAFPQNVTGHRLGTRRQRPILLIDDEFSVSVVVARDYKTSFGTSGLVVRPVPYEYGELTLMCHIDANRGKIVGLYVMPPLTRHCTQHKFHKDDPWFRSGKRIEIADFYRTAISLNASRVASQTGAIRKADLQPLKQKYSKRFEI